MMGYLMPDIPRIYTALAEWIACLIFIFLLKKDSSGGKVH